ncbi:hypothetical protein QE152_g6147 [Popillia japonica]|uniref:Uncharacterized protein n=1 Tax=Popillia japonica TaxID=7064 RepID=A0AAW1MJQ2_POPJA
MYFDGLIIAAATEGEYDEILLGPALTERLFCDYSCKPVAVGRRTRRDWFLTIANQSEISPGNLPAPPSTTQRSICDTEGSETQVEDHAQLEDESITVQQNSPPTSLSIIGDPPQHQIETPLPHGCVHLLQGRTNQSSLHPDEKQI